MTVTQSRLSRKRQNSLKSHFKNIKFEIISPKNSPIPQFHSEENENKVRRLHRMVSNWLNGLPVKQIKTFDAESFGANSLGRRTGASSAVTTLQPTITSGEPIVHEQSENDPHLSEDAQFNSPCESPKSVKESESAVCNDKMEEMEEMITQLPASSEVHSQSSNLQLKEKRTIFVNSTLPDNYYDADSTPTVKFIDNSIRTTKYSILTFIPLNLFSQFKRIANLYFLIMILLQIIPALRQINPAVAALPLFFVVSITAIKDAIEDHRRYRSDKQFNNRKTRIYVEIQNCNGCVPSKRMKIFNFLAKPFRFIRQHVRPRKKSNIPYQAHPNTSLATLASNISVNWKVSCWREVHVGDIIYLKENDPVPADIVLLASSEEECICYVETKDLDGESTLKIKKTPLSHLDEENSTPLLHSLHEYSFRVDCENPTSNLFNFSGNLFAKKCNEELIPLEDDLIGQDDLVLRYPLGIDNLLLRGSSIKNTQYAIGIVVYTGVESKIMLNSGGKRFKRSQIERQLNPMIILNLVLLGILCLTIAIIRTTLTNSPENVQAPYSFSTYSSKYGQKSSCLSGLIAFFSCVLALQSLVPISLYITVEFVRTVQAWFIYNDIEMYNEELDKRCLPKAWNLSDDLGQIEHIFSDKTGTLTKNIMKLRQLTIDGKIYGKYELGPTSPTSLQSPDMFRSELDRNKEVMVNLMNEIFTPKYTTKSHSLIDPKLFMDIAEETTHSDSITTFFQILALCHSAVTKSYQDSQNPSFLCIEYHSQSPDEIALLETCKDLGFVFVRKERSNLYLSILGEEVVYKLLNVIEFSSSRKRMSVIVEDSAARILLLCKGADSVIYERLKDQENELSFQTLENLQHFAEKGLRTLCIAYKELSLSEYQSWAKRYFEAQSSLEHRDEIMEAVAEDIEHDLTLLGATAVEDELQDDVPEAIEVLEKAGIKLWVLTGDKVETAINIGFSCNLLNRNMNLIVIKDQTNESISCQLESIVKELWYECITMDEDSIERIFALVIDGTSLKHAMNDERNRKLFVCITGLCKSIICCRVSPLQKAKVVELIKHYKHATTLAIGDGANDVSMIKTASVGVGLFGREGVQASMASDYALTEFRHLVKLLLVHGRWSYWRTALTVLTSLFRNLIFTSIVFYFQFFCFFTASSAYDFIFGLFYNLLFTLLPSVAIGIFESDLTAEYCIKVPQLYRMGIKRGIFNIRKYLLFMFQGIYISLVCFFFTLEIFGTSQANGYHGHTLDLYQFGSMLVTEIVVVAVLFTGIHISNWNVWIHVAVWGNLIIFLIFFVIYSFLAHGFMYGQFLEVFGTPTFYFAFALILAFSLGPTFLYKYLQNEFFPRDIDIVQHIQSTKRNEQALFQSSLLNTNYPFEIEPISSELLSPPEIHHTVPDLSLMK